MNPYGIVVVGPGLIGKQHIQLLQARSDCQVAAIVAPDHEHNHLIASEHGTPLFTNLQACIARCDAHGVIVSSPNEFHFQHAKTCLDAGIPALIEKPITASVTEGKELVELVRKTGGKMLIGHHRAHSPLLRRAREIIQSGRLGRIVSVIGSAQFYKPSEYFEAGPWRKQPGGGPILINLIHEIGNLRSLCGEITSVHAFSSSTIRKFEVEDTVSINLQFASGTLGTFMLSDTAACANSWEQTSRENPAYPTYVDQDCYMIAGTQGSLSVPTFRMKYAPDHVQPSWWVRLLEEEVGVARENPLSCQLDNFVQVIKGEAEPLVTAADGLRNLVITEAIAKSALERRTIDV